MGTSYARLVTFKLWSELTPKALAEPNLSPQPRPNAIPNPSAAPNPEPDPEPSPHPIRSEALAKHDDSFAPLAKALSDNAAQIEKELIDCQGSPVDLGGYWQPDPAKVAAAMNPTPTLTPTPTPIPNPNPKP